MCGCSRYHMPTESDYRYVCNIWNESQSWNMNIKETLKLNIHVWLQSKHTD